MFYKCPGSHIIPFKTLLWLCYYQVVVVQLNNFYCFIEKRKQTLSIVKVKEHQPQHHENQL